MKPTLTQVFAASLLVLTTALGSLLYRVFESSRESIVESSERIRLTVAAGVEERVNAFLTKAAEAVTQFQGGLARRRCDPRDPAGIESELLELLVANTDIGELTFTYGEKVGVDANGDIRLAPTPRGQISVVRVPVERGGEQLWSRLVYQEDGRFVADRRELRADQPGAAMPVAREVDRDLPDPTSHATFTTPASGRFDRQLLSSDLHYSQLDADLPEARRRVEMSVQKSVRDARGNFAGVFRVGLLRQELDRAVRFGVASADASDRHRIFICDEHGRLVAPIYPGSRIEEEDDDSLRVTLDGAPPEIRAVLSTRGFDPTAARPADDPILATFRPLSDRSGGRDWYVGIVVPRASYTEKLSALRTRLLVTASSTIAVLVTGGLVVLRSVRRAQGQIARETAKMNRLDFSPARADAPFRDVGEVLESIERAKTAMRAMGKYVPLDLVRRLYAEKAEPVLGGAEQAISVMFTDIKDFTAYSEQLQPNVLADALGRYLDAMTRIIQHETRGTIDKYIGDAIMAIWNAPEAVANHAQMACHAALRCRDVVRDLARSADWDKLPPFETRFGLHCGEALVGHFGAHDRMNYTAIGDTINLASRLEGLNKEYGTSIIASEAIVQAGSGMFDFRLLDLVAVKGKSHAVRIYELVAEKEADPQGMRVRATYEEAFACYTRREFARALEILERCDGDGPSRTLAERCRAFSVTPPAADWTGVYVSVRK